MVLDVAGACVMFSFLLLSVFCWLFECWLCFGGWFVICLLYLLIWLGVVLCLCMFCCFGYLCVSVAW